MRIRTQINMNNVGSMVIMDSSLGFQVDFYLKRKSRIKPRLSSKNQLPKRNKVKLTLDEASNIASILNNSTNPEDFKLVGSIITNMHMDSMYTFIIDSLSDVWVRRSNRHYTRFIVK